MSIPTFLLHSPQIASISFCEIKPYSTFSVGIQILTKSSNIKPLSVVLTTVTSPTESPYPLKTDLSVNLIPLPAFFTFEVLAVKNTIGIAWPCATSAASPIYANSGRVTVSPALTYKVVSIFARGVNLIKSFNLSLTTSDITS